MATPQVENKLIELLGSDWLGLNKIGGLIFFFELQSTLINPYES